MERKEFMASIILLCVAALIYLLSPMLLPFVLGVTIAYFLSPVVEKLTQKGVSRTLASFVPVLLFYLTVIGLFAVLIPMVSDDISRFIQHIPMYMEWVKTSTSEEGFLTLSLAEHGIDIEKIISPSMLFEHSKEITNIALKGLQHFVASTFAIGQILSILLITPLVVFYLLADWQSFMAKTKSLLPQKSREKVFNIMAEIDQVLSKFIRGQIVVCLLLGLFYGIALSAVGLEMGFVIGFMTGILSFIPYVGMLTGLIAAALVAFMQFQLSHPLEYGLIVAVFAAGQVLEGFYLTPKFVGTQVGLHPVWVIFAVMAGGQLGGFLGILLALPIMAILTVLIPRVITLWHKSTK